MFNILFFFCVTFHRTFIHTDSSETRRRSQKGRKINWRRDTEKLAHQPSSPLSQGEVLDTSSCIGLCRRSHFVHVRACALLALCVCLRGWRDGWGWRSRRRQIRSKEVNQCIPRVPLAFYGRRVGGGVREEEEAAASPVPHLPFPSRSRSAPPLFWPSLPTPLTPTNILKCRAKSLGLGSFYLFFSVSLAREGETSPTYWRLPLPLPILCRRDGRTGRISVFTKQIEVPPHPAAAPPPRARKGPACRSAPEGGRDRKEEDGPRPKRLNLPQTCTLQAGTCVCVSE